MEGVVTREVPEETKDLGLVLMEDVKPYYTAERKAKLVEEFQVSLLTSSFLGIGRVLHFDCSLCLEINVDHLKS